MADTRKDRRAPVSLKVRFKSATVDEFIEHYCKDVSRGGIFIKSSQPMSIGTLLKFQFQLKDESSLIRGVGRVVWTRSPEDAVADQPAGMGIKFIKMDNESRAMVDRIVDGHGFDAGAYDEGRATASEAESSSDFPPAGGSNFFPDVGPAQLPPPEDRTAVRQAAQFLAAALSEAGTDHAAAREAEQKAAEARLRTAQIEAGREAEAERKGRVRQGDASSLPSMIIDPTLGSSEGRARAEQVDSDLTPLPISQHPTVVAPSPLSPSSIPPAPYASSPYSSSPHPSDTPTATGLSAPRELSSTAAGSPKRSPLVPMAILTGIIAVAAYVATRDKPASNDAESSLSPSAETEPQAREPATIQAAPTPGEPEQAAEQAAEPAPAEQAAEPDSVQQPAADAAVVADASAAPEPAAAAGAGQVQVEIKTVPKEAELTVDGVPSGQGPQVVSLSEGATAVVTARAPGYAELKREIKVRAGLLPVKLVLASLPYVVRVVTTPPGARVSAGPSKRGTSPADLVVGAPLHGSVGVIARLPGHESARVTLTAEDFSPTAENNLAVLDLNLNPLPKPAPAPPKPKPKPAAPVPAPAVDGASERPQTGDAAAAPEPAEKPAEKPPAGAPESPAEPAPEERSIERPSGKPDAVPANPFG